MGEPPPPVFDESGVAACVLPPLLSEARSGLSEQDRERLIQLFSSHVYGHLPAGLPSVEAVVLEDGILLPGLGGRRSQFRVTASFRGACSPFHLLLFLPDGPGPFPFFLGLNFRGNHTVHADPGILLPESWVPDDDALAARGHMASAADRGARSSRWPVAEILGRGFGLATVYCGDFAPDDAGGSGDGILRVVRAMEPGVPDAGRPGAIGAWAFGLRCALEALGAIPATDPSRAVAIGHSRLGKAALWAAALDTRFAAAISNNTGCGGAALSRRRFGERLVHINSTFPHWFAPRFHEYNEREDELPVDQHQLLALIAPRGLAVGSAADDHWADPRGEFLALREASIAWGGESGMAASNWPAPGASAIAGHLAYHIRPGGHDLTAEDWRHYLDFCGRLFRSAGGRAAGTAV